MAEIEEAKLNTKIGFDITEAENKIARLKKQLSQINSQLKSKDIDNSISTILEKKATKLESTINQIKGIVDVEKDIKKLSTQINNSFRGVDGKFKSAAEHISEVASNWKRISTYMKAVYAQTAGINNMYTQLVYKAQTLKLMFGTEKGQTYAEHQLERKAFKMEAQNRYYDTDRTRAFEEIRARTSAEREAELIRRSGLTEAERQAEDLNKAQEKLLPIV